TSRAARLRRMKRTRNVLSRIPSSSNLQSPIDKDGADYSLCREFRQPKSTPEMLLSPPEFRWYESIARAALSSNPSHSFRWQRLRRPDVRNRLVSVASAGDRRFGNLAWCPAGHLHGRNVPGQLCDATPAFNESASVAGLWFARAR